MLEQYGSGRHLAWGHPITDPPARIALRTPEDLVMGVLKQSNIPVEAIRRSDYVNVLIRKTHGQKTVEQMESARNQMAALLAQLILTPEQIADERFLGYVGILATATTVGSLTSGVRKLLESIDEDE